MRPWLAGAAALALGALTAVPAAALDPRDVMRPCRRHDLIGAWRVLRFGFAPGATVDRSDPAYLPNQRYVFHSNATMTYVSQDVPFTREDQRELPKLPPIATWALDSDGRLVRQRDGVPSVERADCKVLLDAVTDPRGSQPRGQRGDIVLTEESADRKPLTRRLLRKIRGLGGD
jgi:hypothetical protein